MKSSITSLYFKCFSILSSIHLIFSSRNQLLYDGTNQVQNREISPILTPRRNFEGTLKHQIHIGIKHITCKAMYTLFYQCFPLAVMILTDVLIKLLFDNYHDKFVSQGNTRIFRFFWKGAFSKNNRNNKRKLNCDVSKLLYYYRSRNKPYVINRWSNIN